MEKSQAEISNDILDFYNYSILLSLLHTRMYICIRFLFKLSMYRSSLSDIKHKINTESKRSTEVIFLTIEPIIILSLFSRKAIRQTTKMPVKKDDAIKGKLIAMKMIIFMLSMRFEINKI